MTPEEAKVAKRRVKRRRQRARRKERDTAQLKAGKTVPAKSRKKRRAGAPSFAALSGAPIRIPDALNEGRRSQGASSSSGKSRGKGGKRKRPAQQPKPRPAPAPPRPVNLAVDRFIATLPQRSMYELRQQWLNVLRLRASGKAKGLGRFQEALVAEWEKRRRLALTDPDHFEWPSAEAAGGDGGLTGSSWPAEGVLGFLGYRVGITQGLSELARRHILDLVCNSPLPPINGPAYMREWATPGSAARLRKLAEALASFARNAKRKRGVSMDSAIADWERDLNYLYDRYYVGKFGFAWPSLSV